MGKRLYNCNDGYFSTFTQRASYWAGFLAADGYITKCGRKVELHLSTKDKSHLEQFREDVRFEGSIHTYGNSLKMSISSRRMVLDLEENFGIRNAKTYTLRSPPITDPRFVFPFIGGYIDGDGSLGLYRKYPYMSIVGTKWLLRWIKEKLDFYVPINNKTKASVQCPVLNMDPRIAYYHFQGPRVRGVSSIMESFDLPLMRRKWDLVK